LEWAVREHKPETVKVKKNCLFVISYPRLMGRLALVLDQSGEKQNLFFGGGLSCLENYLIWSGLLV
jgi:hypothetical protein